MNIQGVILAGGKSSRMGTNKAMLPLHNKKVIEHIIKQMECITKDIIIITNEPALYKHYDFPLYTDRYENKGPLAGLETALYHMTGDIAFVTPCDTPFIHHSVYEYLLNNLEQHDAIVPKYDEQLHPLSGIYRRSVHPFIERRIQDEELRMTSFYEDIDVYIQKDFNALEESITRNHFFNMNTMDDFHEAKRL